MPAVPEMLGLENFVRQDGLRVDSAVAGLAHRCM